MLHGAKVSSASPLLPPVEPPGVKRSFHVGLLAAFAIAATATAMVAVVLHQTTQQTISLASIKAPVMYYYVPQQALKSADGTKLPLELSVPQGNGKKPIKYTLIASPLTVLDGNATASAGGSNATSAAPAAAPAFSCTLDNIKAKASAVYGAWAACVSAPDYKKPNAAATRRLLEDQPSQSQGLNWIWKETSSITGSSTIVSCCFRKFLPSNHTEADCIGFAAIIGQRDRKFVIVWWSKSSAVRAEAQIHVENVGATRMDQVKVGDRVEAAALDGTPIFSRVYFIHDHAEPAPILQLRHSSGVLELTESHSLPIYSNACGERYCNLAKLVPAKQIRRGDLIYVATPSGIVAQEVTSIDTRTGLVRYILTESGNLVVGGALASVLSTAAGPLETLPFWLLDKFLPGALQSPAVSAAIYTIIESPILQKVEASLGKLQESLASSVKPIAARTISEILSRHVSI